MTLYASSALRESFVLHFDRSVFYTRVSDVALRVSFVLLFTHTIIIKLARISH